MHHVEIPPNRLRIGDFDRYQLTLAKFMRQCDLWQKTESQFALDHAFRRFDCFHLEDHIRQQARASEKSLR